MTCDGKCPVAEQYRQAFEAASKDSAAFIAAARDRDRYRAERNLKSTLLERAAGRIAQLERELELANRAADRLVEVLEDKHVDPPVDHDADTGECAPAAALIPSPGSALSALRKLARFVFSARTL